MQQRLLELYERELGYLRQSGEEFSRKYPAIAGRLLLEPDRCSDPHVERILEAFSFIAARIHLRLEDDLPELTEGFLDIVYPHLLQSIPAMSIAQFHLDSSNASISTAITVPAGRELRTQRTLDEVACRFRTVYPIELWPIEIVECTWRRPEQVPSRGAYVPDAATVLRVVMRTQGSATFAGLNLKRLCFYLAGEKNITLPLYEFLSSNLLDVLVRDTGSPSERVVSLGADALKPMGFEPEQALLPHSRRSFSGYRLLQEYFSLPEKFLFFSLNNLEFADSALGSKEVELLFYFSSFEFRERGLTLEQGVRADTLRLGCSPVINLFRHTAEPILLTHARHEYPIVPSFRNPQSFEVYSVDEIAANNPSRRTVTKISSLFERYSELSTFTKSEVYWRAIRRQSLIHEGSPRSTYISIVDVDGLMVEPDAEVLSAYCTCTNGTLSSKLVYSLAGSDLVMEPEGGIGEIKLLHRPTSPAPPPTNTRQVWQLISQLSLNHLSLGEAGLGGLKEILRLHNFTDAAPVEKQIAGLLSMTTRSQIGVMETDFGSVAARGTHIDLHLDERHFAGGSAFLFSAILDRFFGLYASMNSFSELSVSSTLRKEKLSRWPPRAGSQVLM